LYESYKFSYNRYAYPIPGQSLGIIKDIKTRVVYFYTRQQMEVNRVEQMKQIQESALALFTRKNADYGDAFAKYGVIGVLMRIEDKIQRCLSISKSRIVLVDDESIKDTLLDLHNYAAMALMLLTEEDNNRV